LIPVLYEGIAVRRPLMSTKNTRQIDTETFGRETQFEYSER
jgi:hypothetical protein